MRNTSTPESAANGEITRLAIVETVLAVFVSAGIAVYFETVLHWVGALLVAPVLLLRTMQSLALGLRFGGYSGNLVQRWAIWVTKLPSTRPYRALVYISVPFVIALYALAGTLSRPVSTVWIALRHPLRAIRTMPQNWRRQALCVDLCHAPELYPAESIGLGVSFTFVSMVADIRKASRSKDVGKKTFFAIAAIPLIVFAWAPSVLYRLSFKSTVILYAPLVFVAQTTVATKLPTVDRLKRIVSGELEKVRRYLSSLLLAVFAAKAGLAWKLVNPEFVASNVPTPLLEMVENLPLLWQTTLVIEVVLTFGLYLFADAALARVGADFWKSETVKRVLSITMFIRSASAVTTVLAGFYFVAANFGQDFVAEMTERFL